MKSVSFVVHDTPRPGGSKKGFIVGGRVKIAEDCKTNGNWRQSVKFVALEAIGGRPVLLRGPLKVTVTLTMPRPKYHYGTGRNEGILKASAPKYHTVKPDATKLWRSTEDALTGILWNDDAQIAVQVIAKVYGETPGAAITVEEIEE